MNSSNPMVARSGWSITYQMIQKSPETLDRDSLLDRIEKELASSPPEVQWSMNFALIYIGTHSVPHRERAVQIGERIGLYRDYPVSKGCTSPFAPESIVAMAG